MARLLIDWTRTAEKVCRMESARRAGEKNETRESGYGKQEAGRDEYCG